MLRFPASIKTIHVLSLSLSTLELEEALLLTIRPFCPSAQVVWLPEDNRDDILYILICTSDRDLSRVKYYIFWQLENFAPFPNHREVCMQTDVTTPLENYAALNKYRDCRHHLPLLTNALYIWDYSLINIKILQSIGLKATHVQVGYSPSLSPNYNIIPLTYGPDSEKDIDVLFLGNAAGGRRLEIKQRLEGTGLNILFTYGHKLGEMQALIKRSKISLNIHTSIPFVLQTVRLNVLLSNCACIISEPALDQDTQKLYTPAVLFVQEDAIVSTVQALIKDYDRRQSIAQYSFEWYRTERAWNKIVDFSNLVPKLFPV